MTSIQKSVVVGAMSLCGIALFLAPPFWQVAGSLVLVGLGGLPHGGMDAFEMWTSSGPDSRKFLSTLAKYLVVLFLAWFSWWLSPFTFWSVFLVISVCHFGEASDLFAPVSSSFTLSKPAAALAKGVLIVFVPVVSFPDAAETILNLAASPAFARAAISLAPSLVFLALASVLVVAAFELASSGMAFAFATLRQTMALFFLMSLLPALVSFALYFVFIHSIPQMHETLARFPATRAKAILGTGILFSIPPLALLVAVLSRTPSWEAFLTGGSSYLFVLIAVLHFPHFWLSETRDRAVPNALRNLKGLSLPGGIHKIIK